MLPAHPIIVAPQRSDYEVERISSPKHARRAAHDPWATTKEDSPPHVGKRELIEWAASTSGRRGTFRRFQDLGDGSVLLCLFRAIWPRAVEPYQGTGGIQLHPCVTEFEAKANWDALKRLFAELRLPAHVYDPRGVRAGSFRSCYSLLAMCYFLYHLSRAHDFTADFAHPVDPKLASFLQSSRSVESLAKGGGLRAEDLMLNDVGMGHWKRSGGDNDVRERDSVGAQPQEEAVDDKPLFSLSAGRGEELSSGTGDGPALSGHSQGSSGREGPRDHEAALHRPRSPIVRVRHEGSPFMGHGHGMSHDERDAGSSHTHNEHDHEHRTSLDGHLRGKGSSHSDHYRDQQRHSDYNGEHGDQHHGLVGYDAASADEMQPPARLTVVTGHSSQQRGASTAATAPGSPMARSTFWVDNLAPSVWDGRPGSPHKRLPGRSALQQLWEVRHHKPAGATRAGTGTVSGDGTRLGIAAPAVPSLAGDMVAPPGKGPARRKVPKPRSKDSPSSSPSDVCLYSLETSAAPAAAPHQSPLLTCVRLESESLQRQVAALRRELEHAAIRHERDIARVRQVYAAEVEARADAARDAVAAAELKLLREKHADQQQLMRHLRMLMDAAMSQEADLGPGHGRDGPVSALAGPLSVSPQSKSWGPSSSPSLLGRSRGGAKATRSTDDARGASSSGADRAADHGDVARLRQLVELQRQQLAAAAAAHESLEALASAALQEARAQRARAEGLFHSYCVRSDDVAEGALHEALARARQVGGGDGHGWADDGTAEHGAATSPTRRAGAKAASESDSNHGNDHAGRVAKGALAPVTRREKALLLYLDQLRAQAEADTMAHERQVEELRGQLAGARGRCQLAEHMLEEAHRGQGLPWVDQPQGAEPLGNGAWATSAATMGGIHHRGAARAIPTASGNETEGDDVSRFLWDLHAELTAARLQVEVDRLRGLNHALQQRLAAVVAEQEAGDGALYGVEQAGGGLDHDEQESQMT
eukprot:jgi/Mesvir1/19389/Mv10424-RA.1